MVALNFSTQNVAPNTALEAIPSGIYPVVITRSEEKPTKSGNGSFIEFEMQIQGGEFNGRKVFDRLNIKNPNQQAVDIAYSTLSAICHVTGRHQIADTGQLHGIPFQAVVAKVGRDDRPGEFSNEVKGYKDAQGNDPGKGGQGAAPGAAPNWAGAPGGGQPAPQGAPGNQWAGQQPAPAPQPQYQPQPGQPGAPQYAPQQPAPAPQYADPNQQQAPAGGPPPWNGAQQQAAPAPQQQAPAPQQPAPAPQPPQGGQPGFTPGAAPPWAGAQQGQQPGA